MPTKPANHTPAKKDEVPIVRPAGTEPVKPADLEPLDHGSRRAFQTSPEPGQREWLTEAEAKKRGLHWAADTKEEADAKKKKR